MDDLRQAIAVLEAKEPKENKQKQENKKENEKEKITAEESQSGYSEEEKKPEKKLKRKKKKKDKDDSEEDDKREHPRHPKKKKRKKDKGSDSSSSSSSSDSEDNRKTKNKPPRKNKDALNIKPLNFKWEDYIKPTCLTDKPLELMKFFVEKTALTRSDINNPNRAYGNSRFKPMRTLLVAPLFEKKYEQIFIDLGLEDAANEELMAWYRGWQEARKDGEWEGDEIGLQVSNGYEQLIELKHSSLQTLMNSAPPLKSRRALNRITTQDVKQWMHAGRAYCIARGIHWKSFSRYMLTKTTLHEEILEGVRVRMNGKVFNATAPWIITTYIEKIILEMMAPPERFDEMRTRLVDEHVRAIQKDENTVHLKSTLEDDAVQLTYVDPSYIGVKAEGEGYIPDDKRIDMKNTNFKQLLIDIIRALDYYIDMNERYALRQPSSFIEREKPKNIVHDLTILIKTKKDRRISQEASSVYKTQPRNQQSTQPKPQSEIEMMNKKIRELEALMTKKGAGPERPAHGKPRGKGASHDDLEEIPESPYKFPCSKCETRSGTEKEKKDHCTNKHHCRVHDGQYIQY